MHFFPLKTLELTIALIKPHAVKLPSVVESIKYEIIQNKFYILRYERCLMNVELASCMYKIHEKKPFYPRLIGHMTSGPIESFLLARENCITKWRHMMGITRACEAHHEDPFSYRGLYGLSNTRNATHGSDSAQSAEKECSVFFPDFCIPEWYNNEEIFFRNGYVKFDESQFVHVKEVSDAHHLFQYS